jgi:hypothetical protein
MARSKQAARESTGGKAPRKQLINKSGKVTQGNTGVSEHTLISVLIANVGTEGANEKFPFWELFELDDRFPHNSLSYAPNTSKPIPIFWNNSSAISHRKKNAKMYFISLFVTDGLVSVQSLVGRWALVQAC